MKTNQILWYNIGNLLHNFLGMTLAHISTFIHWPLYVKLLSSFISARSPSMDLNPIKWRPTVAVNLSSHGAVNRLLDDEEGERKYRIPLLPLVHILTGLASAVRQALRKIYLVGQTTMKG